MFTQHRKFYGLFDHFSALFHFVTKTILYPPARGTLWRSEDCSSLPASVEMCVPYRPSPDRATMPEPQALPSAPRWPLPEICPPCSTFANQCENGITAGIRWSSLRSLLRKLWQSEQLIRLIERPLFKASRLRSDHRQTAAPGAYRKYLVTYVAAEESARAKHKGLWAGHFEWPWNYRHNKHRKGVNKQRKATEAGLPTVQKVAIGRPEISTPSTSSSHTDGEIAQILMARSQASYRGSCSCPENRDRAGRRCGKRRAYFRPGGATPLCYSSDVTPAMIAEYRRTAGR